ncbi:MAG: polysaccharide biosynthesis protein [Eubacterium sp.]|nr:polysaccharide biosynthesis protein [Eubacterium sp.]
MSGKKSSSTNFLVQGSILAIASIISRIIGLLYRVPLEAIIGDVGNDYYSCAFEIYSMMLLISSYSLPLAVSKMVSARVAVGQKRNAHRVFKCALGIAAVTGTAGCLIVFFGAEFLTTTVFKTPMSFFALRVLAPTLIIVAVLGVIRGFFQGLGTMMPSAVSQILEQIFNAVVSVVAAFILFGYGLRIGGVLGQADTYAAAYGAAGGTLGTGIGAVVALVFVIFIFMLYRPSMKRAERREVKMNKTRKESYSDILRILILTIVPVLLSTTIYNLSSIVDQGIFKNMALSQGYEALAVSEMWGIFTGKYKVLINVPISIASAMAASCVPSLAAAYANRDKAEVRNKISSAMHFVMVIAFPCMIGYIVLASPIMQLLFRDAREMPEYMMILGAVSIVFYSISTLSNGILQGINRMIIPVRNAIIALVLHIVFLLVLMKVFDLHIYAVVIATAFFALLMCILNGIAVQKYSRYKLNVVKTFIKPAIASVIMGVIVWVVYHLGMKVIEVNAIWTIISILIGIIVYAVAIIAIKDFTEDELRNFPKGATLLRIAKKFHLM